MSTFLVSNKAQLDCMAAPSQLYRPRKKTNHTSQRHQRASPRGTAKSWVDLPKKRAGYVDCLTNVLWPNIRALSYMKLKISIII